MTPDKNTAAFLRAHGFDPAGRRLLRRGGGGFGFGASMTGGD